MSKPIVSLIAAIGKNRELGLKNGLIWKIPEDLKHFKSTTAHHTVIMGQNTFESIGKPLPDRRNIILTRDHNYKVQGGEVCFSIDEALALTKDEKEVFFIGGASIYSQALELADKLYLTLIDATSQADTYFPQFDQFTKRCKIGDGLYEGIKYEFWKMTK